MAKSTTTTRRKSTAKSTAKSSASNGQSAKVAAYDIKQYGADQALWWYDLMLLMRRFEERASLLYVQQKIRGFCHLYIGQEAIAAGMQSAMNADDFLITAYRDHGAALARGIPPEAVMAELFGKANGCTKGKGGSMHMFDVSKGMYGGHGIVGAQIPLGAGLAFSSWYREDGKATVCIFGDGAARQGALFETFNMAMLWKLPVVFVVENNGYAMGTSVQRSSNVTDLYQIGSAFDMPSWQVDGMNVVEVHEEMTKALKAAREEGPQFLEIKTYRYRGHSMSDPAKYRTKDELNEYKDQDPIIQLKADILDAKLATQEKLDEMDEAIKAHMDKVVEYAENSPLPDPQELYTDVYYQDDYPFIMD